MLVAGVPPGKLQFHAVDTSNDASEKATACPAQWTVEPAVKSVRGAPVTVIARVLLVAGLATTPARLLKRRAWMRSPGNNVLLLYVVPVQMPPPPGSSVGYPLYVNIAPSMVLATLLAMVMLAMLASAWIARKTVHMPVVQALAHT